MQAAWEELKSSFFEGCDFSNMISKRSVSASEEARLVASAERVVGRCCAERKRQREASFEDAFSDKELHRLAPYTDRLPLAPYESVLHLTPRLVNVVTVRNTRSHDRKVSCRVCHIRPARRAAARCSSPRPSP